VVGQPLHPLHDRERLRYRAHRSTREDGWPVLTVELDDPETGLVAEVVYGSPDGVPVLRGEVVLRNEGDATLHLHAVSSLAVGASSRRGRVRWTPPTCCGRTTTGSPSAAGSADRCG
jgi:hypothetical protein